MEDFNPVDCPDYTIARVLEYGDLKAIAWLGATFSPGRIIETLRSERRLSPKSANFWALIYHVPTKEVAALREVPPLLEPDASG